MKPSQKVSSPLDKGDHPELDTSELCTEEQISQYQSMIGSLQWIVTIGRFNVHTAVMTMSGFRMLLELATLTDYSEYTDTYLRCDSRPFALGLKNQTSLTYPILSTTVPTLCMVRLKSSYQKMPLNC
jgi:hypothetical protein